MPIALDDVCFNKAGIMERCLNRIFEEAQADPDLGHPTHVDALVLNLERVCQAAIDLAMHVVSRDRLGLPQGSAEAFEVLRDCGILSQGTASALAAMVGFRNVAVHAYRSLNLDIVRAIVNKDWRVFPAFVQELGMRIDPKGDPA